MCQARLASAGFVLLTSLEREGFALEHIIRCAGLTECYFWATHQGAEVDLLFFANGGRFGVEFKLGDAPRTTRSMHVAIRDLGLRHLWVVYPGAHVYPLAEQITAVPLAEMPATLATLRGAGI